MVACVGDKSVGTCATLSATDEVMSDEVDVVVVVVFGLGLSREAALPRSCCAGTAIMGSEAVGGSAEDLPMLAA